MKYYPPNTVIDGLTPLNEDGCNEFEEQLSRRDDFPDASRDYFSCKALAAICDEIRFFHPEFFGSLCRKWREEYDGMCDCLATSYSPGYLGYYMTYAFAWRLWDELEAIRNENIPDAPEDEADEAEEKTRAAA